MAQLVFLPVTPSASKLIPVGYILAEDEAENKTRHWSPGSGERRRGATPALIRLGGAPGQWGERVRPSAHPGLLGGKQRSLWRRGAGLWCGTCSQLSFPSPQGVVYDNPSRQADGADSFWQKSFLLLAN